jgi:hypothetical protein
VHLLRYVIKHTVTDSPFNTKASCSKCPPARLHFLTHVTRKLVTLWKHGSLVDASCSVENLLE